jgi:hypothetical protein
MRRGLVCTAICWMSIITSGGCQYARNYWATNDGAEQIPLATASNGTGSNDTATKTDDVRQAEAITEAETPNADGVTPASGTASPWSRLLSHFSIPKRIPLPLTDTADDDDSATPDADDPGDF